MLTGQGPYEGQGNQINFHPGVYQHISATATKAWRMLSGAGDLQGQLF